MKIQLLKATTRYHGTGTYTIKLLLRPYYYFCRTYDECRYYRPGKCPTTRIILLLYNIIVRENITQHKEELFDIFRAFSLIYIQCLSRFRRI